MLSYIYNNLIIVHLIRADARCTGSFFTPIGQKGSNMTNLEKLYAVSQKLDEQLAEIKAEQEVIKQEIREKRAACWEEMFDDIYSLRKYSKYLDTGIPLYNSGKKTLGFEIRNDCILVISWSHYYEGSSKKRLEPYDETFFFSIYRDKPFDACNSHYKEWMKYVLRAAENWSTVLPEIKKRLEEKLVRDMKKKVAQAEEKQRMLDKDLKAIS